MGYHNALKKCYGAKLGGGASSPPIPTNLCKKRPKYNKKSNKKVRKICKSTLKTVEIRKIITIWHKCWK